MTRRGLPVSPVLLVLLSLQAATVPERPWPNRAAEPRFVSAPTRSLPLALRELLLRLDEFTQGKSELPESLAVARIDLNGDHRDEFVVKSAQTYSGGPMMFVFEFRDGQCVAIGDGQGTIYFGPRVNGYFELVTQGRGGGGQYTRILNRFEDDRYQPVRIADYRETEPGGAMELVRERSPSAFRREGPLPAITSPVMRDLMAAEARWKTARPRSYEFTIDVLCHCVGIASMPPRFQVTDLGSTVLGPPLSDDRTYGLFNTVEKLFQAIRESIKRGEDKVTVSYDPALGYPQVADLDPDAKTFDDELFFRVIDFTLLSVTWNVRTAGS